MAPNLPACKVHWRSTAETSLCEEQTSVLGAEAASIAEAGPASPPQCALTVKLNQRTRGSASVGGQRALTGASGPHAHSFTRTLLFQPHRARGRKYRHDLPHDPDTLTMSNSHLPALENFPASPDHRELLSLVRACASAGPLCVRGVLLCPTEAPTLSSLCNPPTS